MRTMTASQRLSELADPNKTKIRDARFLAVLRYYPLDERGQDITGQRNANGEEVHLCPYSDTLTNIRGVYETIALRITVAQAGSIWSGAC